MDVPRRHWRREHGKNHVFCQREATLVTGVRWVALMRRELQPTWHRANPCTSRVLSRAHGCAPPPLAARARQKPRFLPTRGDPRDRSPMGRIDASRAATDVAPREPLYVPSALSGTWMCPAATGGASTAKTTFFANARRPS